MDFHEFIYGVLSGKKLQVCQNNQRWIDTDLTIYQTYSVKDTFKAFSKYKYREKPKQVTLLQEELEQLNQYVE